MQNLTEMKKSTFKRKIIILVIVSLILFVFKQGELKAQLNIHSNGVTTINYPSGTTAAKFFSYYSGGDTHGRAIYGSSPVRADKYNWGVVGYSISSTPLNSGQSFGVYGLAGNSTSGYNYGVLGSLYGTQNGAGIYGSVGGGSIVQGRYAGYFYGDVKITGELWVNGSQITTSDEKSKKDIKELEKGNANKLKDLKAIKYKLKNPAEQYEDLKAEGKVVESPDSTAKIVMTPEMIASYDRERYGLSAQEVQLVYPELVVEDKNGRLGVDYIGLIPILIEAIKEQQARLDEQQLEIAKLKAKANGK
jgi:hypothetical protein